MINESENLVKHLSNQDKEFDQLINKALLIKNRIKTMKEFNKNIQELSKTKTSDQSSDYHKKLIIESLYIIKLKNENQALKESVDEHKAILELIMKKYREQMNKMMELNKIKQVNIDPIEHCKKVDRLAHKIEEMAQVMVKAVAADKIIYHPNDVKTGDLVDPLQTQTKDLPVIPNYFTLTQDIKLLKEQNQELRRILTSLPLIQSQKSNVYNKKNNCHN